MSLLLLLACGPELASETPEPVRLQAWVEDKQVAAGEPIVLHVQLQADKGWSAEPELGLPQELGAELVQASPGDWTFELRGDPGSYLIPPTVVQVAGPEGQSQELSSPPIFVDLGVEGPSSDLQPPEALLSPVQDEGKGPLVALLVGGALILLGALAALVLAPALRRAQPQREPAPRPEALALEAWAVAMGQKLPPDQLALQLSAILRRYIEDSTGARATSATTAELLADLAVLPRWGPHLQSLSALLETTDRLKYAGGSSLDRQRVDQDLRQLLQATRPWPEAA